MSAAESVLVTKNRQIKLKIKHLQKEVARITEKMSTSVDHKKFFIEKVNLEEKLSKLIALRDKFLTPKK